MPDPFDNVPELPEDPSEGEIEAFERFLDQGGRALLDQQEAVREAERKRMIRQGEITFLDLAEVLYRRAERLLSLAKMNAPAVVLNGEIELIRQGGDDLRQSFDSTVEECDDS